MNHREQLIAFGEELGGAHRLTLPEQLGRGLAGTRLGDREGQSLDFHDYRQYQPGDDLRRVDWRAYGRSGQMHIKLFREEISPLVEISLDSSASMAVYPGKADAAIFLASFIRAAVAAGDGKPVLLADDGRSAGPDITAALAHLEFAGADNQPQRRAGAGDGKPARIHIGDCLVDTEPDIWIGELADTALSATVIMVLSASELHPDWRGSIRLDDAEQPGRHIDVVIDENAVSQYQARLARHQANLDAALRRRGGRLLLLAVPDNALPLEQCSALVAALAADQLVGPA